MSYWVGVEMFTGKEYVDVEESINHTSNTSEMFHKALGDRPLGFLNKMLCQEAAEILHDAVKYMRSHRGELSKLNPPNGWGSYETALNYITEIRDMADEHPVARLRVSS